MRSIRDYVKRFFGKKYRFFLLHGNRFVHSTSDINFATEWLTGDGNFVLHATYFQGERDIEK